MTTKPTETENNSTPSVSSPPSKGVLESMISNVSVAGTRTFMGLFGTKQLKRVLPCKPLKSALNDIKSKGAKLNNFNTEYPCENVSARWIVEAENRQPDDPVLVYFHGGGYVLGILFPETSFMVALYESVNNPRLSILMLDYSTAPKNQYPSQLQEAVSLYRQLTVVDQCTNIILLGDSSGGNLALELIAHYHYIHPDIVPLTDSVPPSALILISPWVNLVPEYDGSYKKNESKDCMRHSQLITWATEYAPSKIDRNEMWCSPLKAEPEIWKACLPEKTLILWGDSEMMYDDCKEFAETAEIKDVEIESGGIHDSIMFALPEAFSTIGISGGRMANSIFSRIVYYLKDMSVKNTN